jgi:Protein of unknown function (DUF3352)
MLRLRLTITVLTTAIAFAAGCGNDSTSSSDAASLAPAGSLVYGEATLRPEGDQKAAIDDLFSKFPGEGSAGDRIGRLMEKAFAESDSGLSYKDDVEPWLGDEAAFFVSNIPAGGKDPDAAVLVATEDEEATVEAVEKDSDVRKTEHGSHDLYISSDDEGAAAVIDGWLVLGNPGGVKTAIDTVDGDETIEDDEGFKETLEDVPDDRLGFIYVNTPGFARLLQGMPGVGALGQFREMFEEPVLVTANADEAGVRFEGTVPASLLRAFPIVAEGSGAAGELPADSWLALAQPDLGETIEGYLDLAGSSVGGRDMIQRQLEASTGLDLERDVIAWMGDWGAFVRGTSVAELEGAVFIETDDTDASGRFIDAIARLARQNAEPGMQITPLELSGGGEGITARGGDLDKPVHLFQRDGKVVAAYGDGAAQDAIDPAETLADSPAFTQAEDALGGDYAVSFFLAIEPILQLAESEGATADEDWQEVKPYLEPLGALVGGARKDGDKVRSAFGLTVK